MSDRVIIGGALLALAVVVGLGWAIARVFKDCDSEIKTDFQTLTERNKR